MFVEVFSPEILLIFELQTEYICFFTLLLSRHFRCVFCLRVRYFSQFWLRLEIKERPSTYKLQNPSALLLLLHLFLSTLPTYSILSRRMLYDLISKWLLLFLLTPFLPLSNPLCCFYPLALRLRTPYSLRTHLHLELRAPCDRQYILQLHPILLLLHYFLRTQ